MKLIKTWCDSRRENIGGSVHIILYLMWIFNLIILRTVAGAGLIFLYCLYEATPETTVYQLAKVMHTSLFFKCAYLVAVLYTVVSFAVTNVIKSKQ